MVLPRLVTSIKSNGDIIHKFPVKEIQERIISEESINKLLPYMEQVVSNQRDNWSNDIINGTQKNIYTDKYKIAGKLELVKMSIGIGQIKQNMKDLTPPHLLVFFQQTIQDTPIVVINDFIDTTDLNHYGGDIAAPVFKEISDKVFALDSEMKYLSNINNYSEKEPERVSVNRLIKLEGDIEDRIQNIFNDLDKELMPNLKGLDLMDVLFVLENSNIEVIYEGKGKVSYQSIKSGDNIQDQSKVIIKLS